MTIQQFIERAIEGGYKGRGIATDGSWFGDSVFLIPEVWQAVGKVEGWTREFCIASYGTTGEIDIENHGSYNFDGDSNEDNSLPADTTPEWLYRMHRMVASLADGKTIEEFISTL